MSENRNDVPGEPAKDPQAQPWDQAPANAADADAPTQPLYGRYAEGSGPEAGQAPDDSAPETSRQPEPQYASTPGQGPWSPPQGQPQQPGYGAAPNSGYGAPPAPYGYPGSYQAPAPQPGKTMGIIGLILSCLFFIPFASLVGVILSIVAFVQSRKARMSNGPALAGIIIGGVVFVLTVLATVALFVFAVDTANTFYEVCTERGTGTFYVDGQRIDCGDLAEFEQSL
ncbi:DUF4190 domain-containing protein [Arthrobacter sp. NPDC055585]